MVNKKNQGSSYDIKPFRKVSKQELDISLKKIKKTQMKIQQTAFLLIAVTLFFVLAGIFALGFRLSGIKGQVSDLEERNALLLATRIANSPEFSCGNSFGGNRISCVDFDKVIALKDYEEIYQDFWGASSIEIRRIYPLAGSVECNLGNYPNCNVLKIRGNQPGGISDGNFVALCRKASDEGNNYNKCELAKLLVSYNKVE